LIVTNRSTLSSGGNIRNTNRASNSGTNTAPTYFHRKMLTPTNSTGPSHIEAFYASIARFTRTGKRLTQTANGVLPTTGRLAAGKHVLMVSIVRLANSIVRLANTIARLANTIARLANTIARLTSDIGRFARTGKRLSRTTNSVISTTGRLAAGKDVLTVSMVRLTGLIYLLGSDIACVITRIARLTTSAAGLT